MSKVIEQKKLNKYLEKLKKSPNCNKEDLYRWADYIELKCLANKDGFYSVSDFVDDLRPRAEDLGEGDYEEIEEERRERVHKAKKNDKWETLAKESFNIISIRTKVFEKFYPYELSSNSLGISLKGDLELNHHLYLFLLFCSNLQFTGEFTSLTSSFEYMSREVLTAFLPENAIIQLFGSSNTEVNRPWVLKESKFWDKLLHLEKFLKSRILIDETSISRYNKGDGGLDIVGIIPIGDEDTHFPIIFGQCSCSPDDWIKKQSEIKFDTWIDKIKLNTIPQYFMFIPQSYRDSNGNWFNTTNIHQTVLIDRQRILQNFKKLEDFKVYSSFNVVKSIINLKESVF